MELPRLCWNSEGRARFEASGGRHLVSFFSELLPLQTVWRIGIQIPMKGEEVIELDYVKRKAVWPGKLRQSQHQFGPWQSLIEALSDFLSLSVSTQEQKKVLCVLKEKSRVWSCTAENSDRQYDLHLDDGKLVITGQAGKNTFKLQASQLVVAQNYYQIIEVQNNALPLASSVSAKFFITDCRPKIK